MEIRGVDMSKIKPVGKISRVESGDAFKCFRHEDDMTKDMLDSIKDKITPEEIEEIRGRAIPVPVSTVAHFREKNEKKNNNE